MMKFNQLPLLAAAVIAIPLGGTIAHVTSGLKPAVAQVPIESVCPFGRRRRLLRAKAKEKEGSATANSTSSLICLRSRKQKLKPSIKNPARTGRADVRKCGRCGTRCVNYLPATPAQMS